MTHSASPSILGGLVLGLVLSVQVAPAQLRGVGNTLVWGHPEITPGSGATSANPNGDSTPQPGVRHFLSGKVMMDDGSAPPEPVAVERVCGAARKSGGHTDSKGRFNFQVGQDQAEMVGEDAGIGAGNIAPDSAANGRSTDVTGSTGSSSTLGSDSRLVNCDLRAVLPGYRSDVVNLAGLRYQENPDVGTIILHRLGNVQGTTISATSLDAPKDARKSYEKGQESMKKEKWPEAQKQLEKAVEIYPKYATAWYDLGEAHWNQSNAAQAHEAFARAVAADPKYLKPYLPMATLTMGEKKWQEAADTTSKLTRLDPVDYPQAWMFNAIANVHLHNLVAAEESARAAIKADTGHQFPRCEYILALILAERQQFAAALPLMKSYLGRAPNALDAETVRKQISNMESTAGNQRASELPQPK
jgi:tetratricopeptide (TPR) repeat protein